MIKNILVSQPQPKEKSPYFELEKYGVNVTFRSLINVEKLTPQEFRKQRVSILDYTAIVFTSKHAIRCFFELCAEMRISMPDTMKYFATSEAIALYIQKYAQYRKRKVFFGVTGKWDDLVTVMMKHKTEKYLLLQSEQHRLDQGRSLAEKGLDFKECVMFRTVCKPFEKDEKFDYDMVVLFTPMGVESFTQSLSKKAASKVTIATLGPGARAAVEKEGLKSHIIAPTSKAPSITAAIAQYLEAEQESSKKAATKKTTAKKATVRKSSAKNADEPTMTTTVKKTTTARKTTKKATEKVKA